MKSCLHVILPLPHFSPSGFQVWSATSSSPCPSLHSNPLVSNLHLQEHHNQLLLPAWCTLPLCSRHSLPQYQIQLIIVHPPAANYKSYCWNYSADCSMPVYGAMTGLPLGRRRGGCIGSYWGKCTALCLGGWRWEKLQKLLHNLYCMFRLYSISTNTNKMQVCPGSQSCDPIIVLSYGCRICLLPIAAHAELLPLPLGHQNFMNCLTLLSAIRMRLLWIWYFGAHKNVFIGAMNCDSQV